MAFSFEIPKPDNIERTAALTRQRIISSGGTFSGDEQSGIFSNSKRDVEGRYSVGESCISITIIKKPFIYPNSAVESRIREYFEQ